jgi:threonine dehydrogenase-like Zn-dependent dehydrogenase
MQVTLAPYTSCGRCSSCRQSRFNACRYNETLGVQRDGALTQYIAVPWQELHRSATLSLSELALVEPLTVGFDAVDRGRVVYIGYAKQPVEYETKHFVQKELDIRGSRNATPADFRSAIQMLESGRFPTAAVITRSVPFDAAGAALAAWSANPVAVTKIQVTLP